MSNDAKLNELRQLFELNRGLFTALGDPIRQGLLLEMLDGQPKSVAELTATTSLARPSVSHHLKILKNTGLITEQHRGQSTYYRPCAGEAFERLKKLIDAGDHAIKSMKEEAC